MIQKIYLHLLLKMNVTNSVGKPEPGSGPIKRKPEPEQNPVKEIYKNSGTL